MIWKMLMVAERRFRRLHAPELLPDVRADQLDEDGGAVGSAVTPSSAAVRHGLHA